MSTDWMNPKEEEKKEPIKKACPHCANEYINLNKHIKTCPHNSNLTIEKKDNFNWDKHKSALYDALYNAINTIKNKKEVIAQDDSKKYYRDFLRYNAALKELEKI